MFGSTFSCSFVNRIVFFVRSRVSSNVWARSRGNTFQSIGFQIPSPSLKYVSCSRAADYDMLASPARHNSYRRPPRYEVIDTEWDAQIDESTIDAPALPDVYNICNERVRRSVDAALANKPYFNISRDKILRVANAHQKVYAHLIRIEPEVQLFHAKLNILIKHAPDRSFDLSFFI